MHFSHAFTVPVAVVLARVVALAEAFGAPATHSHSVQIEINRALYMDEKTRARNDGFSVLKRTIDTVLGDIANWIHARHCGEKISIHNAAR